jgi:hypothetical protein
MGMRSKDWLAKLCGLGRRRRPSPDDGGEHVRMSYLRPSSGFHPSFFSCLPLPSLPSSCSLHALYSLPPHLFVDPNELTDDHDLRTAVDLEAPVFSVDQRPTHILYNITKTQLTSTRTGPSALASPSMRAMGHLLPLACIPLSIDCPRVFSSCPRSCTSNLFSLIRHTLTSDTIGDSQSGVGGG